MVKCHRQCCISEARNSDFFFVAFIDCAALNHDYIQLEPCCFYTQN